jgi:hypothetical protein
MRAGVAHYVENAKNHKSAVSDELG